MWGGHEVESCSLGSIPVTWVGRFRGRTRWGGWWAGRGSTSSGEWPEAQAGLVELRPIMGTWVVQVAHLALPGSSDAGPGREGWET